MFTFVKAEVRRNISEIKLSWEGPEDIDPVYDPLMGEYVFSETEDVFTSKMSKAFAIKPMDESGTNWRLDLDNSQGYLLLSLYSGGGSINRNRVMLVKDGNYIAVPQISVDFIFTKEEEEEEMSEEEEESMEYDAECYPAFDKSFTQEFFKAVQDCQYKLMKKTRRLNIFRPIKNRATRVESLKVRTEQECHFICFTLTECKAFRFRHVPLVNGCNPDKEDCNQSRCNLLKEKIELNEGDRVQEDWIYGEREICTDSMSQEAKDYFLSPDSRQTAAKVDFLAAKVEYDVLNKDSVQRYSYLATNCLQPLIQHGEISEEEMGIAKSVIAGRIPTMPEGNPRPHSKKVSITVRDPGTWYPNKLWVFTGLYALPGKFVTVKTPDLALSQIIVKIGAHKDPLYKRGEPVNTRDPQVTMDFNITSSSQALGSVYGGLIIVNVGEARALIGQTFEMEFDNVIEAPLFNLDTDTNEEWNIHIKNKPAPWTVFRIPGQLTFVLSTSHVKKITDVTTNLNEWKALMTNLDYAACARDRKKGEIFVTDVLVSIGAAHSGYPICTMNGAWMRGDNVFPEGGTIDYPDQNIGLGHEIGHNISPLETVGHVAINMFTNYALPKTRLKLKNGVWGRKERLFAYIFAGKPDILDRKNLNVIQEVIKTPMDGPDGLGWENEGNWEDMQKIACLWKTEGTKDERAVYDVWAKAVCKATKMNMIEYFEFWNYKLTENTKNICGQFAKEPSNMMAWIGEIADLVDESASSCQGLEGWYGHHEKCYFISSTRMYIKRADSYCEDLGGELGTIENEKDAILANYAFGKSKIGSAWLKSVSAPPDVFPYAENYDPSAQGQWSLEMAPTMCGYEELGMGRDCMRPTQNLGRKIKRTLCQKVMV